MDPTNFLPFSIYQSGIIVDSLPPPPLTSSLTQCHNLLEEHQLWLAVVSKKPPHRIPLTNPQPQPTHHLRQWQRPSRSFLVLCNPKTSVLLPSAVLALSSPFSSASLDSPSSSPRLNTWARFDFPISGKLLKLGIYWG